MRHILTLAIILISTVMNSQIYKDYIGAGHSEGITVTSSDEKVGTSSESTLNGSGLDNPQMQASRFLSQSTLGYRPTDIESVMNLGFETWIDDQYMEPTTLVTPMVYSIWHDLQIAKHNHGIDTTMEFGPFSVHFNYAYFNVQMTNEDLLRQRIATALSEILVVSMNSDLRDWAESIASYHDLLAENAFGNYHDILNGVTKHFSMGYFLSHLNNPKTDTINNIRPDENYAREIMQLFSIGLYELNLDGTPKRDSVGNLIPTYDNTDIKEMAKVFTGLGAGALIDSTSWPFVPIFGLGPWAIDKTHPMGMFEDEHEPGPKVLLKDVTINIPGDGMAEVDSAVSYLFHHPNVGPFISYRLIQRLVKSNPTPAYVARVASKFNNNGSGIRGDMKAVIKAILLDPEARDGEWMSDVTAGQVRAPHLRYMQYCRFADITTSSGYYNNNGWTEIDNTMHWPYASPTVFNFYLPNFTPKGGFDSLGLVAPELKIQNTASSINYINRQHAITMWDSPWWDWEENDYWPDTVSVNTSYFEDIAEDPERMINELDVFLTHGQLTEETRQIMRQACESIYWSDNEEWRWYRVRMLIYLYLLSPDYVVLR